ncbi:DNA internalization-related competence protein ComEC/Rec2 [Pullulanibacillus sp. KACC 23026]|uniref:DNA internalization-related competence protein ComEC/Rec2 n=1 Tax=Pullulanibacillus sp. KACC 23026 TaxID=3028315 RepID=UPI0023B0479C|nr:DNA internalization-related competence protein ComEC/Rec2 [Pullulanibacillus sp. KACC 23026]WEG14210.1 DNA internalization-related competence protein ComEC/Rec2 [Pullulanibacillus sp. KACC 23026]
MMRWVRWDWLGVCAVFGVLTGTAHHRFWLLSLLLISLLLIVRYRRLLLLSLMVFLTIYGLTTLTNQSISQSLTGDKMVQGRLQGAPVFDGDHITFIFQTVLDQEIIYGNYYVQTLSEKEKLEKALLPGVTCSIRGDFGQASPNRNPYGFNFNDYLQKKSVSGVSDISSISDCQSLALSPMDKVQRIRLKWIDFIQWKLPTPLNGYILALVFGTKDLLPADILSAYQTLGLSHLLTVSGLHVGLLSAFFLYLLKRLGWLRETSYLVFLCAILPCYVLITGNAPSVLRAGLMIAFVLVNELRGRALPPIQVIGLIGAGLLFFSPDILYQLSFQLSFTVTLVILYSWRLLKSMKNRWLLLSSLSGLAQLGALPLILYQFFQFSWLSIFMNLLYVPFICYGLLPISFLFAILSWLPSSVLSLMQAPLFPLIHSSEWLLAQAANWSYSMVTLGRPNGIEQLLLAGSLMVCFRFWEALSRYRMSVLLPYIMTGILIVAHIGLADLMPTGKVVFLDVGQGDSIFIQLPHNGQTILIDTGGQLAIPKEDWQKEKRPFEVGRDVVLNELKGMGITHLDLLVLTHRDVDHIGGAKGIVGHIPIRTIMVSSYFVPSDAEKIWLNRAKQLGTKLIIAKAKERWQVGDARFQILWPAEPTTTSNGTSLVIKGDFGGKSWLFTGDLEAPEEKKVLSLFPDLKVDLLKVGHHGSQTSSSDLFIKSIQPKLAIISVGANNRYGHPNRDVLDRLTKYGIPYLRTDEAGGITIRFDDHRILSVQPTIQK